MNISKNVIEQLEQFAIKGPTEVDAAIIEVGGGQAYIVGVPAAGEAPNIALTVADYDRYSVILLNVEVSFKDRAGSAQNLQPYAEQVIERLTYLEEPFALLELDAEANLAQLRSEAPRQENESVTYWETLIWSKPQLRARLARYRWSPGQKERETIPYPATFVLAGRLAEDLALSLVDKPK